MMMLVRLRYKIKLRKENNDLGFGYVDQEVYG